MYKGSERYREGMMIVGKKRLTCVRYMKTKLGKGKGNWVAVCHARIKGMWALNPAKTAGQPIATSHPLHVWHYTGHLKIKFFT